MSINWQVSCFHLHRYRLFGPNFGESWPTIGTGQKILPSFVVQYSLFVRLPSFVPEYDRMPNSSTPVGKPASKKTVKLQPPQQAPIE